ncbi:hypothetical protein HO173_000568 [Letharia columbiana]|uniref:Uncharacterized protein n=1 Tax=Letharia columbiana TaxID=112416 RepID=A0A8H6LAH2_9LECA|nr:uncharacterized protein HO173_000568 [Letharia columbiana]KAF6241856.1 hypothetical protein HO173_000568 [Letharia columbiana]
MTIAFDDGTIAIHDGEELKDDDLKILYMCQNSFELYGTRLSQDAVRGICRIQLSKPETDVPYVAETLLDPDHSFTKKVAQAVKETEEVSMELWFKFGEMHEEYLTEEKRNESDPQREDGESLLLNNRLNLDQKDLPCVAIRRESDSVVSRTQVTSEQLLNIYAFRCSYEYKGEKLSDAEVEKVIGEMFGGILKKVPQFVKNFILDSDDPVTVEVRRVAGLRGADLLRRVDAVWRNPGPLHLLAHERIIFFNEPISEDALCTIYASYKWVVHKAYQPFEPHEIRAMIFHRLNVKADPKKCILPMVDMLGKANRPITQKVAIFARRRQDHWITECVEGFRQIGVDARPIRPMDPPSDDQRVTTSLNVLSLTSTAGPPGAQQRAFPSSSSALARPQAQLSAYGAPAQPPVPQRIPYDPSKTYDLNAPDCSQGSRNSNQHDFEPGYGAPSRAGSPHARAQFVAYQAGNPPIEVPNKDTSSSPGGSDEPQPTRRRRLEDDETGQRSAGTGPGKGRKDRKPAGGSQEKAPKDQGKEKKGGRRRG